MRLMPTNHKFRVAMLASWDFLAFCIYHDIHGGLVSFHFNINASLDKAAKGNLTVPTRFKHSDIILAICVIVFKLWTEHDITVSFVKVKGHRAWFVPFDKLTHPEQINEMMDTRAKARVDQILLNKYLLHQCRFSLKDGVIVLMG
jgi:hypothetical protein